MGRDIAEGKDVHRIKEYIGQGYARAVVLDMSKYFDMLKHTILLKPLRKQVKDERVIQMVKRYLKSGVMADGGKRSGTKSINERKTDKLGLL